MDSETTTDIIAEMRHGFNQPWNYIDCEWAYGLADRLEAAHKREVENLNSTIQTLSASLQEARSATAENSSVVGNAAKLREALSAALEQVNKVYDILSRPCVVIEEARQGCREARGVLIPALAATPRNCDVGTVEEQDARLWSYCAETRCGDTLCRNGNCSLEDIRMCTLRWAQMPYEEGGER